MSLSKILFKNEILKFSNNLKLIVVKTFQNESKYTNPNDKNIKLLKKAIVAISFTLGTSLMIKLRNDEIDESITHQKSSPLLTLETMKNANKLVKSQNNKENNASLTNGVLHKVFTKIEGNNDCFNDVIIFKSNHLAAKYNLIYFGGDIQDYQDEMKKSLTSRSFTDWNLINTGNLLFNKFASNKETIPNIFIVRADYFHLRCFANYSNFVPSTDFGVPLGNSNETTTKLDMNDESSNSSISINDIVSNKLRCWEHLQKLIQNSVSKFNVNLKPDEIHIDQALPIILCAFSKGCIVLNQLCNELPIYEKIKETNYSDNSTQLNDFIKCIKHLIWLDGGHSGTSDSWIVKEDVINLIKNLNWSCYVYVTPYQLKSQKYWAIEEYQKFIELLNKLSVNSRNIYYFKDKEEEDFDVNLHFELLKQFDTYLN